MKKNDTMGYVAYLLMLALAVCVGFFVLRPDFSAGSTYLTISPYILVLLAILIGIVITGVVLELGHLLGAKIGKYEVTGWVCLGLGMKKKKDGKKKFYAGNYDGLTGETIVTPIDTKKSNPRPIIYMGLLFLFLEIIICVVMLVLASSFIKNGETSYYWLKTSSEVVLTVAGMVFLYDVFPSALDSKNDGYLITILNNKTNVIAYNEMLLAEDKLSRGLPKGDTPVYDEVTDFTAAVNDITLYDYLDKGDYAAALTIIEKTIACEKKVSTPVFRYAEAEKVAIMIDTLPLEEAKKYFIALPLDVKKHIASLSNAPSVRAYVLANGLIEESIGETEAALNKTHDAFRKLPKEKKAVEKKLLKLAVEKVLTAHPDWDFSDYGYTINKDEKVDAVKTETADKSEEVVTASEDKKDE